MTDTLIGFAVVVGAMFIFAALEAADGALLIAGMFLLGLGLVTAR